MEVEDIGDFGQFLDMRINSYLEGSDKERIAAKQGWKCKLCGSILTGREYYAVPITPPAEGGSSEDSNFQALCEECNQNAEIDEYNRRWDEQVYGSPSEAQMRLTIEQIPKSTWYENLRRYVSQEGWDRIRKATYVAYGDRCGVCGAEGILECHEIWEFDEENHIQKLTGLIALCQLCHQVKHMGLTRIRAREGKADYAKAIEHFMKVNNCDRATFDKCIAHASMRWFSRSEKNWRIDLGKYAGYANAYEKRYFPFPKRYLPKR